MKKFKHWMSSLFLAALLALPFTVSSCDDDDPFVGVAHMGIEDGATVNVGEEVELEAQLSLIEGDITYRWTVNGEEVEKEIWIPFQMITPDNADEYVDRY